MTYIEHLEAFMARRKWSVLAAKYGCTVNLMFICIRKGRRPETLTPDDWEDILVYRQEWHKANAELKARRKGMKRTAKKKRQTLWLKVNGEVNTLRRHFINAGYRDGYESTIAKQQKCKPSEIPLEVIGFYLRGKPEVVEMPENWQEIMYGSKVGAQKSRVKGQPIAKKPKKEMSLSDKIEQFLTMPTKVSNPAQCFYY